MSPRLLIRYSLRETMGLAVMGVALFWAAGRLDWWQAWAALAVMTGWSLGTGAVIVRFNPDLLAERLGPRRGAKSWDTAILSGLGVMQLARYVLAGLDHRYDWTGGGAVGLEVAALAACALGQGVFVWATASNAWFSQVVRIQAERAHAVATGGPYRFVRHPGYAGSIVYELASPLLLASWASLVPSVIGAVLLVVRTTLEDRTLKAELEGYSEYASRVRHRLLPGVW